MKNKTIIITGANSGIGLATAKILAKQMATVILIARNQSKGQQAVDLIKKETNNPNIHLQVMDLSSLKSIRQAANQLLLKFQRIDVLINNAGIMNLEKKVTKDGFEEQFGVNHLGHFLFTNLLLNRIKVSANQTGEARILFLSSGAHQRTKGLDFEDLNWKKRDYASFNAYADSKLANILTANEIARRYGKDNIYAHAIAPGAIQTNIYRNDSFRGIKAFLAKTIFAIVGKSPEQGAATPVFLATSPQAIAVNGKYWKNSTVVPAKLPDNEEVIAEQLWTISEELTGF